jgi:hypothetical protein
MNKHLVADWILALLLIFGLASEARAQGLATSGTGNVPGYSPSTIHPYHTEIIETLASQLVPSDTLSATWDQSGIPYISYTVTGTGLRLAYRMASPGAGNCGPGNSWHCETVDPDIYVNGDSAIDTYSGFIGHYHTPVWKIGIAHTEGDVKTKAVNYAEYRCLALICNWQLWPNIDLTDSDISFRFDPNGVAHIAYYQENYVNKIGNLRYATLLGDTSSNYWQFQTVNASQPGYPQVGLHPSLDFNLAGEPRISFNNVVEDSLDDTEYQSASSQWNITSIDPKGVYSSLQDRLGNLDAPRIAAITWTEGLDYCEYINAGWSCSQILPLWLHAARPSMDADGDGVPVIGYEDTATSGVISLDVAFKSSSLGVVKGNCGAGNSWYCETVVEGQSGGQVKNWSNSIHIDPATGLASIAYYANTSGGNTNLCFAYQTKPIFLPLVRK